jgi:hypothetical protein
MAGGSVAVPPPSRMGMIERGAGGTPGHDRGPLDHRGAQRDRIAALLRRPDGSRPQRPENRRDQQTAGRDRSSQCHWAWPADRRQAYPPTQVHPRQLPGALRRPLRDHRLADGRPLHRIMDRRRRLTPEVIGPNRTSLPADGLRGPRSEGDELLPRPEPVPRELDDVRCRVGFLFAGVIVGPVVVFHRFADLFPVGRSERVLPAG